MWGNSSVTAAATSSSVGTWVGSSPVPRQQYQRSVTGSAGAAEVAAADGGALPAVVGDGFDVVPGPHATARSAIAESTATRRVGSLMRSSCSVGLTWSDATR